MNYEDLGKASAEKGMRAIGGAAVRSTDSTCSTNLLATLLPSSVETSAWSTIVFRWPVALDVVHKCC